VLIRRRRRRRRRRMRRRVRGTQARDDRSLTQGTVFLLFGVDFWIHTFSLDCLFLSLLFFFFFFFNGVA
jgi:hypothetical protein